MMWLRRRLARLVLGAIAALIVGCSGPRAADAPAAPTPGAGGALAGITHLMLPSVTLEIGRDGRVSRVAGMRAATVDDLAERFTGQPLFGRIVVVDRAYLRWFDRAGIQHVTVVTQPDGLFVMVNGRPLPYLAWDRESLANVVDAVGDWQREAGGDSVYLVSPESYRLLKSALPLLHALPLRVDVRLPAMRDADRVDVPLPGGRAFAAAKAVDAPPTEPLDAVDVDIEYRSERDPGGDVVWVPSLAGVSTADLAVVGEMFDVEVPRMRLRRDLQQRLASRRIESVELRVSSDGLHAAIDGRELPHVAWNETTLTNLSAVLEWLYPEGEALPADAGWVPVVRATAPMYNDYALAVRVHFPVGADGIVPRAGAATVGAEVARATEVPLPSPTARRSRAASPRTTATAGISATRTTDR